MRARVEVCCIATSKEAAIVIDAVLDSPVSEAHAGRESGGDAGPLSNDTFRPASTRGRDEGLPGLP
jgi:hypothetical protein